MHVRTIRVIDSSQQTKEVNVLILLYGENRGTENLSSFSKDTQSIRGDAGLEPGLWALDATP